MTHPLPLGEGWGEGQITGDQDKFFQILYSQLHFTQR